MVGWRRYLPGRSRLLETDHSLEDVSFRFPEEVGGELSASMGRRSLDAIELASATVAKSLPPNKLAAFGDSSMSGITAIQNDRSEPYLLALRTMPASAGPAAGAAPSQSFRREPQLRGRRTPADTVRAFDEVGLFLSSPVQVVELNCLPSLTCAYVRLRLAQVLGRLTGQPLEAPKKDAAPKKEKAASASREPEPQMMGAHSGEEKEIVGRSAAAIRARLERKVDDVRYDDLRFRDLGVRRQSTLPGQTFH
jgi:hypothetical protein